MHIAFIAPFYGETTLDAQGGAQVWASQFMNEAVKRGHTFDLYAVANSINEPGKINLVPTLQKGIKDIVQKPYFKNSKNLQKDKDAYAGIGGIKAILEIKQRENNYDLIIDSSGARPIFSASWNNFKKPLIVIGHDTVEAQYVSFFKFLPLPESVHFVFPTKFQVKHADWIPETSKTAILHGTDTSVLPFIEKIAEDNLTFIGRYHSLTPKGLEIAVEVANRLDLPLDLFTQVDNANMEAFNSLVMPKIKQNEKIKMITPPQPPKNTWFNSAKVLLFPTLVEEPFGLVMIEAMAAGTPVIAFARGSVPEIIKDGETGFIVNPSDDDIRGSWITQKTGIEGLCEAVNRIYSMSDEEYNQMRQNIRKDVEEHFNIKRMVNDYEEYFKSILNNS